jgi:hypothetical protein
LNGWLNQQGTGDFVLTQPASQTAAAGSAVTFQAAYTPILGFTGTVNFNVTGLPSGATVTSLSPLSSPLQGNSIAVNVPSGVIGGTYPVAITAASGSITHMEVTQLIVQGDQGFSITVAPNSPQPIAPGGAATYTVTINSSGGYTGTVSLSASGGPPGATLNLSSGSVPAGGSVTMTVPTPLNTASGSYTISVTGTASAGISHFGAAPLMVGAISPASIISPMPGPTPGGSTTFTWSAGIGATSYTLIVGSSPNTSNYYPGSSTTATSAIVTLPTSGTAYATLTSSTSAGALAQTYVYPIGSGTPPSLGSLPVRRGATASISPNLNGDTLTGCSGTPGLTTVTVPQMISVTASPTATIGHTPITCSTAASKTYALYVDVGYPQPMMDGFNVTQQDGTFTGTINGVRLR